MRKLLFIASILFVTVLVGCNESGTTNTGGEGEVSTTGNKTYRNTADTPDGALLLFLEKLGNRDYAGAFELQKNKAWGATVEEFSSTKAFGGVVKTTLNNLDFTQDESGKKMVYAEVTYQDEVNGDKTFKQKFYLQSFGGEWKIVDMKVVSSNDGKGDSNDIYGEYSYHLAEDMGSAYMRITKISDTEIEYSASVNSAGMMEQSSGTAGKQGGKYVSYNEPSVTFTFKKGTVVVTDAEERKIPYPISGTFKKNK